MRNINRAFPFHQLAEMLIHFIFGAGIERLSRFIQNNDRRVLIKRPRYGDFLSLSA